VTDSRMKGRKRGLFGGPTADEELHDPLPDPNDPDARQALQVLMLAQRTADDHVAQAQRQAEKIRADARATAEQIAREARAHAEEARRAADKALADARGRADQMDREAQAEAEQARREIDRLLADARARAEQLDRDAQAHAENLEREAEQRYEEAVGGLSAKRAALQQQIEALQKFDLDYRARLRSFMQGQLRALGVEEPPTKAEIAKIGSGVPVES
jgi:cell division septum initiation protein DivIVA